MNMDFIRRRREKLGLNQQQAAERAGLNPSHWRGIECGSKKVGLQSLLKVLSALDLELQIVPKK